MSVAAIVSALAAAVTADARNLLPRPRPIAVTGVAHVTGPSSATVAGTVDLPRLAALALAYNHRQARGRTNPISMGFYFEYATDAAHLRRTSVRVLRGGRTRMSVAAGLTGLRAGRTYRYRVVAVYLGRAIRASERSFSTPALPRPLPPSPGNSTTGSAPTAATAQATPLAPGATTGGARAISQNSAVVSATVNPHGSPTTVTIQYGPSAAYGQQTPQQSVGAGGSDVSVSVRLDSLSSGSTYHYRVLAASTAGSTAGADQGLTTMPSTQQVDADRAMATYQAMQKYFYASSVYPGDTSSLYVSEDPQSGKRYSYLWPFTRALVGTLTLDGIPPSLLGGATFTSDVSDRLTGLGHYLDASTSAYDSYPVSPWGSGGDKYYDDQAWVGLALAADYDLTGNSSALAASEGVFGYVYPGGWDAGASFQPGGVFWVNQSGGAGASNHDRTATANAPNAELGLRLESLDPAHAQTYDTGAQAIYDWINHYLYNVQSNPTDPRAPNPNFDASQPPIVFDKVAGSNSIGKAHWTYNQGALIAANVAEYRRSQSASYLADAEAIAKAALATFSESDYINHQPAAFDAIFFTDLLKLYSVTTDTNLKVSIQQTIQTFADDAWSHYRSADGLFHFPYSAGPANQLLDQGAVLQVFAALAWDSTQYSKLP